MADKHIQLKIHTGNGNFDELFPVTKAELVEVNGKKLSESFNDVTAQLAQTIEKVNRATSELTVDSEVILARGDELVLDDRLNKMDVKIATKDEDIVVSAKNIVKNGNFDLNATYWGKLNSNNSAYEGVLTNTGDGTLAYPQVTHSIIFKSDNLYYAKAMVRVKSSVSTFIRMSDIAFGTSFSSINNPIMDVWYNLTGTFKGNTSSSTLRIYHAYTTSEIALAKEMELKYIFVIDLTETFGAGNEPSSTIMDNLMKQFPNSWFDGTVNIYNSKNMMGMFFKELKKLNNAIIALGGNV